MKVTKMDEKHIQDIAFAEGNRLDLPVILDTDAKSKCEKYMHLGMELAGTRRFGEHGALYDLSALERKDKYELFLGGNYGQCVITTGTENGKHLLLVKDSFANSFVPFLTGDYETITMLDLRYFRGSVQELAAEADDILVLTEITNLAASGEYFKLGK